MPPHSPSCSSSFSSSNPLAVFEDEDEDRSLRSLRTMTMCSGIPPSSSMPNLCRTRRLRRKSQARPRAKNCRGVYGGGGRDTCSPPPPVTEAETRTSWVEAQGKTAGGGSKGVDDAASDESPAVVIRGGGEGPCQPVEQVRHLGDHLRRPGRVGRAGDRRGQAGLVAERRFDGTVAKRLLHGPDVVAGEQCDQKPIARIGQCVEEQPQLPRAQGFRQAG